jgi:hypothetical protein
VTGSGRGLYGRAIQKFGQSRRPRGLRRGP